MEVEARPILIAVGDPSLARVLALWLGTALPGRQVFCSPLDESPSAATAIVTPSDCTPSEAAERDARGLHTIVLTPVARPDERARYLAAGAAYLVMSVDNAALMGALAHIDDVHLAISPRAASNQRSSAKCSD